MEDNIQITSNLPEFTALVYPLNSIESNEFNLIFNEHKD